MTLESANESFLSYCTEDTRWNFVGEPIDKKYVFKQIAAIWNLLKYSY